MHLDVTIMPGLWKINSHKITADPSLNTTTVLYISPSHRYYEGEYSVEDVKPN